MQCARRLLIGTLILLFFGLSFNAYACLVPLFATANTAMKNGCGTPQEQPTRQFCDAFKNPATQASPELQPLKYHHTFDLADTTQLSLLFDGPVPDHDLPDYVFQKGPPLDVLLKTTVLRL
jgi:hypothetical protein